MKKTLTALLLSCTAGCSGIQKIFTPPTTTTDRVMDAMNTPIAATSCSPMLGWLGGICCLGGMAMLMLTGGRMGWRPLIGGICFVILNYALALYASWFFLPVVVATSAISLAWAGKIIYKIINDDNIKIKETKL